MARQGVRGLWEARTGCKTKWQEADLQTVEQWIEQDARTYKSSTGSEAIRAEAGQAKPKAIATPSTKKGLGWKRTRHSHRGKQDPEQNNSNKTSIH